MEILKYLRRSKPMAWAKAALVAGGLFLGACADQTGGGAKIDVVADAGDRSKKPCELPEGIELCDDGETDVEKAMAVFEEMAGYACDSQTGKPNVKGRARWNIECAVTGLYVSVEDYASNQEDGPTCAVLPDSNLSTTQMCNDLGAQRELFRRGLSQCLHLMPDEFYVTSSVNLRAWGCGLTAEDIVGEYGPEAADLIEVSPYEGSTATIPADEVDLAVSDSPSSENVVDQADAGNQFTDAYLYEWGGEVPSPDTGPIGPVSPELTVDIDLPDAD